MKHSRFKCKEKKELWGNCKTCNICMTEIPERGEKIMENIRSNYLKK